MPLLPIRRPKKKVSTLLNFCPTFVGQTFFMKDPISVTRIQELHPDVRQKFIYFITECEVNLGIVLRIMEPVYRSIEVQNELYAQGRTKPGNIVTNAPGGTSYHNYGMAVDVCAMNEDGSMNWNYDNANLKPIADKYGLEWGGAWKHQDKPHFEYRNGFAENCSDLFALVNSGQVDENGFVILPNAVV